MLLRRRFIALALVLFIASPAFAQARRNEKWVATWATALVARAQPVAPAPSAAAPALTAAPPPQGRGGGRGGAPPITVNNQTIRQIVRVSVGGSRIRVVVSNAFGTAPVQIGAAH